MHFHERSAIITESIRNALQPQLDPLRSELYRCVADLPNRITEARVTGPAPASVQVF